MVKQLKTAIKHLNMGLELVFPGRVIIGYSKKKGQYYVWRGFQKTYSTKRPDDLIKKPMGVRESMSADVREFITRDPPRELHSDRKPPPLIFAPEGGAYRGCRAVASTPVIRLREQGN